MKKFLLIASLFAAANFAAAEEESFPAAVAKTELTEEQKKEAAQKMDEALAIYDKVLSYDKRGSLEALKQSLQSVDKRIARCEKDYASHSESLKKVKLDYEHQEKVINSRSYSEKKKEDKLLELTSKFTFYKTYHQSQASANKGRLERLAVRRTEILDSLEELGAELEDSGKNASLSLAERLRKQRLEEMKKASEENKKELEREAYEQGKK